MDAKQYLSQAYYLDKRINSKIEQVASLRELATKATASVHAERVSGTRQRSPMENAVLKLIDLENEINDDIDRLVDLKRELSAFIAEIDNHAYRIVLELRYLNGNTWEEVADVMGYDLRWIYRLHGKALKEAEFRLSKYVYKGRLEK